MTKRNKATAMVAGRAEEVARKRKGKHNNRSKQNSNKGASRLSHGTNNRDKN